MKKQLLALVLGAFLLCSNVAFSANSANERTARPIQVCGAGPVIPYTISIDTVDMDLTVVDPPSTHMACIVGAMVSEGTATNITVKSASTTEVVIELAANQGVWDEIGPPVYCTIQGEDLVIQASAAITSGVLHIVEARSMECDK